MKKIMTLAAVVLAISCGQNKPQKALVLYYSQNGSTKVVADAIASALNADMEEVVALNPYDGDFGATIARCQEEMAKGELPEVAPVKADLSAYDVIFLGYPIWFGTYAPPVQALLNNIDLNGKKVVPFCTFGSGGLDTSSKDFQAKFPDAEILPGYGVRTARLEAVPAEVDHFLKESGFIAGEYFKAAPFGEAHAVSAEESALFDAAVGDYPMIHAKAAEVAARAVEGGMEYLFTANNVDNPGTIKVYVLALDGQAPVFTQVLR